MSEKITNTFTFYGNKEIKELESEIIKRFQQDRAQGKKEMTAVKRILFGLSQDADFNACEKLGADWAWYFGSTDKFELESKECSLDALQNYITAHAAKLDSNVVIQMDYLGNTPTLIGTRFTCMNNEGFLTSSESERSLNCDFCDEDDVEETILDLEQHGRTNVEVMSYQSLDELIIELRDEARLDFYYSSGKNIEMSDSF